MSNAQGMYTYTYLIKISLALAPGALTLLPHTHTHTTLASTCSYELSIHTYLTQSQPMVPTSLHLIPNTALAYFC